MVLGNHCVSAVLEPLASSTAGAGKLKFRITRVIAITTPQHVTTPLITFQDAHVILGNFRRIFKDPSGEPQRDWIDNVPNDGVIYYRWMFNESRVLITNPKALGEVLVQRNYDFVKPERIRNGLGRLLGVGILLAEGDEHKACLQTLETENLHG